MKRLGPYPGCLQTELADPLFLIRSNLNKEVVMGNTLLAESERLHARIAADSRPFALSVVDIDTRRCSKCGAESWRL